MTKRLMALTLAVAVLILAVPGVRAQAPADPGGMAHGGRMHMLGMMQRMADVLERMAEMEQRMADMMGAE